MCGISGILSTNKLKEKQVKRVCSLLEHRGPDDSGFYTDSNISLGMRRLAIIDLKGGHQPIYNKDKSLVIVFNGEIYNYKGLRKRLAKKHSFKTQTDTEVVLKAFEEFGKDCVKELRGMFAFAIWNSKKKELFIARDRVGEKPLAYYKKGKEFAFASESQALIKGLNLKPRVNEKALVYYFLHNFHHVPDPYSMFDGVKKLPPASHMLVKDGEVKIEKYWRPSFKKQKITEKIAVKKLNALLSDAVKSQELASDVPVGAMLSGGVDSSAIIANLSKPEKTNTYSISANEDDPELKRALLVSKKFNTNHKSIHFNPKDITPLPDLIKKYGEPLNLLPAIYSYKLSKHISKDLKVALNGNGADELFYGYDGTNNLLLTSKLFKIFDSLHVSKLLGGIGVKFKPLLTENAYLFFRLLQLPMNKRKGELYRYSLEKKHSLFSSHVVNSIKGHDFGDLIDELFTECDADNYLEKSYYAGLMLENAHSITIIGDVTGMSNSLEIRSPFLDHRLIEFASSLPVNLKSHSLTDKTKNKYVLKRALEGVLPREILYAKKMGFGYNVKWQDLIKTEWRALFEEKLFTNKVLEKSNLFNIRFVREKFNAHVQGREDNADLLWGLLCFEVWYEEFILERKQSFKLK